MLARRQKAYPLILYGHWHKQRDHAVRLAAVEAYPGPGKSRTILPGADG